MTSRGNNLGDRGSTWPGGLVSHIDDWGEFAVDYLDGRVSPEDKAAIEQHLADCPSCASRMAAQQSVITFLQRTPQEDAPESMEDAVLGELLFPTKLGAPQAFRGRELQSAPRPSWTRRLRPWLPVTAAVAVILIGIVAFGVLRSGANTNVATKDSTTTRYATEQDATAGATVAGATAPGITSTTAAAGVATTVLASSASTTAGNTSLSVASAPTAIRDEKAMVTALKSAPGPAYVSFEALPASGSTSTDPTATATTLVDGSVATTTETIPATSVDDVVSQISAFTGLEQLSPDLSMGGPTFAAFVSHKQLTAFLDLLFSIKSSVKVDLALRMDPEADVSASAGLIVERKAQMPVLEAQVVPQPAIVRYSFTTSTLVPADAGTIPSDLVTPDDEGTHVLIVIYVRR
jgi:anti-sigma factor RsiW